MQSSTGTDNALSFPLSNKTILVTRATGQANSFIKKLHHLGAQVIAQPALEIHPPSDWTLLDQQLARLADFNWLVLTSANGVTFFFERLKKQGYSLQSLSSVKLAVVGRKTAKLLNQQGLTPDFVPPEFISDSLVEHFPDQDNLTGSQILYPCLEHERRELLISELSQLGATVVDVPAYRSACPNVITPEALSALKSGIDAIAFASPKTARCFHQLLDQYQDDLQASPQKILDNVAIASIGPLTSTACLELFGRVDIQPEEYTLDALTEALTSSLNH